LDVAYATLDANSQNEEIGSERVGGTIARVDERRSRSVVGWRV